MLRSVLSYWFHDFKYSLAGDLKKKKKTYNDWLTVHKNVFWQVLSDLLSDLDACDLQKGDSKVNGEVATGKSCSSASWEMVKGQSDELLAYSDFIRSVFVIFIETFCSSCI